MIAKANLQKSALQMTREAIDLHGHEVLVVARAIWQARRYTAAQSGIDLEEWGDGSVPIANHIFDEAVAAISAMTACEVVKSQNLAGAA